VLALGAAAGGDVGDDPRSSDFLKLRFGDTRLDFMAGMAQVTTLIGRIYAGERKDSDGDVSKANGWNTLIRFMRSKLAPVPGLGADLIARKDFRGQPIEPGKMAANLFLPLAFKDIYTSMTEHGIDKGTALAMLSVFGVSVQTYGGKAPPTPAQRMRLIKTAMSEPTSPTGWKRKLSALRKLQSGE
jgi:hypothetical protein